MVVTGFNTIAMEVKVKTAAVVSGWLMEVTERNSRYKFSLPNWCRLGA